MKFQRFAAAMLVGGSALIVGCPDGSNFGFGNGYGSGYEVIPDGTYFGNVTMSAEYWENGVLLDQGSQGIEAGVEFYDGSLLSYGRELEIGDWEDMEMNEGFWMEHEVWDIEFSDWVYQVSYDVWAELDSIPMEGTEFVTYDLNSDGSITMFDSIQLTSLEEYDGGMSSVHVNTSGTLAPGYGYEYPSGGYEFPDIFDVKSGKIRQ